MLAPAENVPITGEETSLSTVDVISMSMHNLIAFVSSYRPWWSEFLALGSIDRPTSFSSAASRVKLNLSHFAVNYFLLTAASVTLFLIGDPTSLLTVASFVVMWLLLYFYRDNPLVLCGQHINDRAVARVDPWLALGIVVDKLPPKSGSWHRYKCLSLFSPRRRTKFRRPFCTRKRCCCSFQFPSLELTRSCLGFYVYNLHTHYQI